MSKRTAATETLSEGQPYAKASGSGPRRSMGTADEMGEFEDQWEDEIESDEEVHDAGEDQEDGSYSYLRQMLPISCPARYGR